MEFEVLKLDDIGNGILKNEGKVCFVPKTLPGEVINIKVIKDKKNYQEAKLVKILKESPKRIKSICPYYFECGGCNFLHINYQNEVEFKKNKILKMFSRLDNFYETKENNYRNKIIFHVKSGKIGFYDINTNDLISINYCYLIKDKMNQVLNIFNNNFDSNFNGQVLIRENSKKEIMLVIDGLYQFINILKESNLIDNLIYNDKILKGNDYFIEYLLNYKFKVNYHSFFQVNLNGLEIIYKILSEFLKDKKINSALDLYSGTSVLGIFISHFCKNVISVEINKFATVDANYNKEINNITNLEIINDDVSNCINKFTNIDLVLLDPTRSGLNKKSINYLKQMKSKYIIYISCSMDSLKRDSSLLNDLYNIKYLYGVDMFPRTKHCEVVMILERK